MSLVDEQMLREQQSVTQGIGRLRAAMEKDEAKGRAFDNEVGQAIVRRLVERSIEGVEELQRQCKRKVVGAYTDGTRLSGFEHAMLMLDAEVLAFIAIRTICNSLNTTHTEQTMSSKLAEICNLQVRWDEMQKAERERLKEDDPDPAYNRVNMLKREVKQINPRSLKKWLKKLDDLATTTWDRETRVKFGNAILNVIVEACPDMLERGVLTREGEKQMVCIQFTEAAKERIEKKIRAIGTNAPWLQPMVCPPKKWSATEIGGYLAIPHEFVKSSLGTRVSDLEVPELVYKAINAIQETPWKINVEVLEIAQQALADNCSSVLPVTPVKELPEQIPQDQWEQMTAEEKSKVKLSRRLTHDNNFRLESKRQVVYRQVQVAKELIYKTIYFPHNLDFRGRAYPLPQDLNPQADDFGRGLLTFATSKKLGDSGWKWLRYHVASCYGLDKEGREDQLEWVTDHLDELHNVAADPLGDGLKFWMKAEDKWQFLAACFELEAAFLCDDPREYECSLPISVDGSCNGLQHLSAMGLDPVGAQAVNLGPGPRQDIYGIVADKVANAVSCDLQRDFEIMTQGGPEDTPAHNWYGHVTRKVVKRGVMTKPYGLTHIGMRDQLISDRHKCWPDVEGDVRDNATYMRDLMAGAIEDTVHASVAIMDWMQECAKLLAAEGKGIMWTTPTGFHVHQYYSQMVARRYTVSGVILKSQKLRRVFNEETEGIRKLKQVQSIAPNIVHSFDAAHMQMAVEQAIKEELTTCFSAVHDSFGVHACDMDRFLEIIKGTFCVMYDEQVLMDLYYEFKEQAEAVGIEIPQPPALGDFEISDVMASDFFFA